MSEASDATADPAPEIAASSAVRWTAAVLAASALVLALCNAESARNWSEGFPPSPAGHALRATCETWADLTQRIGLARPRAMVQTGWKRLHDLKWRARGR
jgi:hypothetical protein